VIAFAVMMPVLSLISAVRSSRVNIVVDDRGIRFQNLIRHREYSWLEITAVTLKRWGARIPVDKEVAALLPLGVGTYGRIHGVALTLADGSLSPTSAATGWLGTRSRKKLLDTIQACAAAHDVRVMIRSPNNGQLFGIGWDIRIGEGVIRSPGTP
jgi:hypothetical protein